jgi:Sulfotransferase domain
MPKYALLTYPKAGSQWVRDVIFDPKVLARVPGVEFRPLGPGERFRNWAERDDGTCAGPFYVVRSEDWDRWAQPDDVGVHVGRDPRDVLVSWVFSMLYSHASDQVETRLNREPLNCLTMRHRLMVGMIPQTGMVAARTWKNCPQPNVLATSYETLVANEVETFAAIFGFFGWTIPRTLCEELVAEHSFEARSGGRPRGETNEQSHYRRGVAGDWNNYFDRALGELFESAHPGGLVHLGYERENDWFESLPKINELLDRDDETFSHSGVAQAAEIERLRRRIGVLESSYALQRTLLDEYERLTQIPVAGDRA